jgi:hypothetical protein
MKNLVRQFLNGIANSSTARSLRLVIDPIADRQSSQNIVSGALAITGAGSTTAKIGSVIYGVANGAIYTKAANTNMPALVGTVTNTKFNVFVFSIDKAGNLTTQIGLEGSALNTVVMPEPIFNNAIIGFVIINPTGTGNFVGGTTALDDATVVPNAVYVNVTGGLDATILP